MTELQHRIINTIRNAVVAYSETLDNIQDRAELFSNFLEFCKMNKWDLKRFEADSISGQMLGTFVTAGLQKGLEESKQKTRQPWKRKKKGKR